MPWRKVRISFVIVRTFSGVSGETFGLKTNLYSIGARWSLEPGGRDVQGGRRVVVVVEVFC